MNIIFATNNQHKVAEVKSLLPQAISIITLAEAGIDQDIPEPHATLHENAAEKSRTIHQLTGQNCFSEDTGLEVEALQGEPGVKSARYAGEEKSMEKNIHKLLHNLAGNNNRKARFRTVVSLILEGKEYLFEGICPGEIVDEPRGTGGFGYDSVFVPAGAEKTFAEMTMEEKNTFSHRQKAISRLVEFLNQYPFIHQS